MKWEFEDYTIDTDKSMVKSSQKNSLHPIEYGL